MINYASNYMLKKGSREQRRTIKNKTHFKSPPGGILQKVNVCVYICMS